MSDPQTDEQAAVDAESRLVGALHEFEAARRRPFRFSSQAGSALTSAWTGVLGGVTAGFGGQWWIIAVIAVGVAVSWTSWFLARRHGTLQPFLPVLWTGVLGRGDRRALRPVLLGRLPPASAAQRALAEMVVDQQRTSTAAVTWPLVGMGLTLLGLALSSGRTWLVVLMVATVVLIVALSTYERARNRRVDRLLTQDD